MTRTVIRNIYVNIKQQFNNPNHLSYRNYGVRGITVCQRWHASFDAFAADLGPRQTGNHSVGRIDNDGGYWCGSAECPECSSAGWPANCRWKTLEQQAENKWLHRPLQRVLPRNYSYAGTDTPPAVG